MPPFPPLRGPLPHGSPQRALRYLILDRAKDRIAPPINMSDPDQGALTDDGPFRAWMQAHLGDFMLAQTPEKVAAIGGTLAERLADTRVGRAVGNAVEAVAESAPVQAVRRGVDAAERGMEGLARRGIKAWHGSPSRTPIKTGDWSLEHLGKNRGGNVHTEGIYFAGGPVRNGIATRGTGRETAELYLGAAERGGERAAVSVDGRPYYDLDTYDDPSNLPLFTAADALASTGKKTLAENFLRRRLAEVASDPLEAAEDAGIYQAAIEALQDPRISFARHGRLHRVELDVAPDQLLHLDKKLSDQSPEMQKLVAGLGESVPRLRGLSPELFNGRGVASAVEQQVGPRAYPHVMREAGIPGAMADPETTASYYIMYDPERIKTLRYWAALGLPGAGAAALSRTTTDSTRPQSQRP